MMWLVLSGTITSMVTIKEKSHVASYLQKGDIFLSTDPHELSELLELPTNHQVLESPLALSHKRGVAKENSIVLGTPIRLLSALGKRHPEWYRFVVVALLRLVAYHTHREYQFLTMSTEERYLAFLQEYPRLAARMSQREVAQYLGLTPVGLNRVISGFVSAEIFPDHHRRSTLPDVTPSPHRRNTDEETDEFLFEVVRTPMTSVCAGSLRLIRACSQAPHRSVVV